MPPKVKISDEAIIEAALDIVRNRGIASLNARDIAKQLGCSIQPIFHNFQTMDNLKRELYRRAETLHGQYMTKGLASHQIPFLGMGMAYIEFARKEKNLFRFLFMSDEIKGKGFLEMVQEEENKAIVALIAQMTGLEPERAEELFVDIWLMVQGIASLVATNEFNVSEAQIEKILKDSFSGFKYQLSK